jgi:hypothetical protein
MKNKQYGISFEVTTSSQTNLYLNVTLKYFATQPKLSSKQVRWQDTLALFNVDIRHKPEKENVVPDALSRKH